MKTYTAIATIAILSGVATAENAPVRKRFDTKHKSSVMEHKNARLADKTHLNSMMDSFGRGLAGHGMKSMSASMSMSMPKSMSMGVPENLPADDSMSMSMPTPMNPIEPPNMDEPKPLDTSGAMTIGSTVSVLAAAGAMMLI